MLWTPQKGRVKLITNSGIVGTAAPGTIVTSNATTLLDGAVTELISAAGNTQDSWGINIWINNTSTGNGVASQGCMDILIGGATDDVLISALICGYQHLEATAINYFFPLHIPRGKRIAAVFASVLTNQAANVVVTLFGGGLPPFRCGRKVTTYGTQIDNARGQAVTPAVSGGAASVTQMTAATSTDHFAFYPGFQPGSDNSLLDRTFNIGIGVGASTEERIGTWQMMSSNRENITGMSPPLPAFCDVPAGSRLTLLVSNSGTNDAAYDGLLYAVS